MKFIPALLAVTASLITASPIHSKEARALPVPALTNSFEGGHGPVVHTEPPSKEVHTLPSVSLTHSMAMGHGPFNPPSKRAHTLPPLALTTSMAMGHGPVNPPSKEVRTLPPIALTHSMAMGHGPVANSNSPPKEVDTLPTIALAHTMAMGHGPAVSVATSAPGIPTTLVTKVYTHTLSVLASTSSSTASLVPSSVPFNLLTIDPVPLSPAPTSSICSLETCGLIPAADTPPEKSKNGKREEANGLVAGGSDDGAGPQEEQLPSELHVPAHAQGSVSEGAAAKEEFVPGPFFASSQGGLSCGNGMTNWRPQGNGLPPQPWRPPPGLKKRKWCFVFC
ncbi:MAG: hypothetical protein L6R39_002446 [Caloplaca ligustica]|nr:MAG: hypothetical protein L6R39_002446 [Caloplaca ligustica]